MNWAVLTSRSGHELSSVEALTASGVQAYCPITTRLTKPKRKSSPVKITQAAFPGYLFAEAGFSSFGEIPELMPAHIHRLYMGEELCTVSDEEVETLREGDDERSLIADAETKFHAGDHVKVLTGPLVDRFGVVLSAKGQRAHLLMAGSTTKVYMPTFSLKKITAPATLQ